MVEFNKMIVRRLFISLLTLLLFTINLSAQESLTNNDEFARQVIGEINVWRMSVGLWPLEINATLQDMAFSQAEYLITQTNVPSEGGDFHRDSQGRYPRQRARQDPFNWPSYNIPQQILIGENAGIGSVKSIVNFWRGSTIHSNTVANVDYREIGVAALPSGSDHVVIVVLGGRPNVLPAMLNPDDGRLYLSDDRSSYAGENAEWFTNAATVEYLDTSLNPISAEPIMWSNSLDIPDGVDDEFVLRYSDGTNVIDTTVHKGINQIVLPGFLYPITQSIGEGDVEVSDVVVASESDDISTASSNLGETNLDQKRTLAFELLGEINAWRIEQGQWPLAYNETLEAIALQQASYLVDETTIPSSGGDFHLDADGGGVEDRAIASPYNWPIYESVPLPVVAENAAVGDVDFALQLWRQSMVDRINVLNSEYREAGIAVLPLSTGDANLFIMVFGSQPGVFPIFSDIANNSLILSNETISSEDSKDFGEITEISIFGSDGQLLSERSIPWEPEITLPNNAGDSLFLLLSDGMNEQISQVDLQNDVIVLPGNTGTNRTEAQSVVSVEATSVQLEVTTISPTPAPTNLSTSTPTSLPATQTPVVDVEPITEVQVEVVKSSSQVRLIYDQNSITLVNISDERVDISDLIIVSDIMEISVGDWASNATVPITSFPSASCLQIWSWMRSNVAKPSQCQTRWSVFTIAPNSVFWTEGEFTVQRDGVILAVCSASDSSCEVDI